MTDLDLIDEHTQESVPAPAGKPSAVDVLRALVAQRPGGEVRPQQEQMVAAVENAIRTRRHLVVQAGTGTGKSLGYAIPAIVSDQRIVISTATKQLSEQIVAEDLPTLARLLPKVGAKSFTYALIKGRANYACKKEIAGLLALDAQDPNAGASATEVADALFEAPAAERANAARPSPEDLKALNEVLKWAEETTTGDRSHAPAVSDKVWNQVSTDAAGCPGMRACPFGQECFAEFARAQAKEADVVVTNHAQVANDLRSPVPMLGEYAVLIADETHELESYLSSAWGHELAPTQMKHHVALAARKLPRDKAGEDAKEVVKHVIADLEALADMLADLDGGLKPELPQNVIDLMAVIAQRLVSIAQVLNRAAEKADGQVAAELKGACGKITEAGETVLALRSAEGAHWVRWLDAASERRPAILKCAPLWVGPELMSLLGDKTLIATSATITVGGRFDSMVRTLALDEQVDTGEGMTKPRGYDTLDVGTPFNYDKQAVLYVPAAGAFPEPVGRDRFEHTAAVIDDMTALITAAGGRTLALFTTRKAADEAARQLRTRLGTPVLAQGDAPPSQLLADFTAREETTLVATMGFWHGVNVPGPSLSCVIMDKIPFAPMDDPLTSARRTAVDAEGRNGFIDVYVAGAAIMLAQGAGRLVRGAGDKGVVAILDPRLHTKRYGTMLVRSVPPMRLFTDRSVVEGALTRLTGGTPADQQAPAPSSFRPAPKPAGRRAAPSRATTRGLTRNTRGTGKQTATD